LRILKIIKSIIFIRGISKEFDVVSEILSVDVLNVTAADEDLDEKLSSTSERRAL
jgi:hypothetical protein